MINKRLNISKKNFLLFIYLIILALIGPLIYWVNGENTRDNSSLLPDNRQLNERISSGSNILVTANSNVEKKAGVKAFTQKNYDTAAENFAAALRTAQNDPEALIYLNNAVAIANGNTYKIGVSVPIGGNLGVAKEILRGVAQAQNEINQAGGINDRLVVVEIANDDNNPAIAEQIAKSFIKDRDILAVIGHNDSNTSIAAAPMYQAKGLVMITPTSSADVIPTIGPYIFRTTPNTRSLASTLADYAVNTANKTKFALCIDSNSVVSKSFKEEFTWSVYNLGGKVLPTKCDFSAPDFLPSQIVSRAISDGAEAILVAPSVTKVNRAVEIAKANEDRLTLLGNHSFSSYTTLKEGQNFVNGMTGVVAWHPNIESENSFVKGAEALWGGSVGWRTAMAYDAAKTIFEGLEIASSRDRLKEVLANRQFIAEGATQSIDFLPSGDRNIKGQLVRVQPGSRSGTGYDFVSFDPISESK